VEAPLSWERELWRGRPSWAARLFGTAGEQYVLTDVRLVGVSSQGTGEIALHDIADVDRSESRLDRLLGTSTLVVRARDASRVPLTLRHIRRGTQLAGLLELVAGQAHADIDPLDVRAALAWEPRAGPGWREALAAYATVVVAIFGVAIGLRGKTIDATHAPDDPISPGGHKRSRDAIIQFMSDEVMPWARATLGPLKGGADRVTCGTCHGRDGEMREWRMPAVAALPAPDVKDAGWERYTDTMDAQMRNAIYGYLAEPDKQTKAAYMREVVMPGMARLLRRAPYDFTRTYAYNRSHLAFGCYHCHRVK